MDAGESMTNLVEMLCLLGLNGITATNFGFSQHDFFNDLMFDKHHNPYPFELNNFISMCTMERLDQHICFTRRNSPAFIDWFYKVHELIKTGHQSMKNFFSLAWVVCLNESID
jgi:hypothetical protein